MESANPQGLDGGPQLFCRYAQPPNLLGYCGPDDGERIGAVTGGVATPIEEVRLLALAFDGAWPYLELIGGLTGRDPLSAAVVEAYWVGSGLLSQIPLAVWGNSVSDRFRRQADDRWEAVENAINGGGVPNHAFHVFCVYPWVGLLREGFVDPSLRVLDRCRIGWGRVVSVGEPVVVTRYPLTWVDDQLRPGEAVDEPFRAPPGLDLSPGDMVSLHWDFVCDRLDPASLGSLSSVHDRHLRIANDELASRRLEPAR